MSRTDSGRLAVIDSLRFIAAGLVLFQHLAERHVGSVVAPLVELGPGVLGVVLFFLVSGYVIPFSIRGGLDPRGFAIRRIMRIYPLYLAALAAAALLGTSGALAEWSAFREFSATDWTANLLLVQEWVGTRIVLGVSWTLIIELAWYGLFALSFLWLGDRAASFLALGLPAALFGLAVLSLALETRIPLARLGMIYAAALGYQIFRFEQGKLTQQELAMHVAGFLCTTWGINYVSFGVFSHPTISLSQAIGPWTIAPLLFLAVVLTPLRGLGLLSRGAVPVLGAASYSIYLLHPFANAWAHQAFGGVTAIVAALAGTALLAWAGYQWIEKPGIALGRRLATRSPQMAVS